MKKAFALILGLLISTTSFSQETKKIDSSKYIIEYQYKYLRDTTDIASIKSRNMVLIVGKEYSRFSNKYYAVWDSVLYVYPPSQMSKAINEFTSQHIKKTGASSWADQFKVIKNYPSKGNNLLYCYSSCQKENYGSRNKEVFDWELINGSDSLIMGHHCMKAICKKKHRKYIAWFSPEIPIDEGPYKFYGLPGLIMKIKDSKGYHDFEITGIRKDDKTPVLMYCDNIKELSIDGFVDMWRRDILYNYKCYGGKSTNLKIEWNNAETESRILHDLRTSNNFIEPL